MGALNSVMIVDEDRETEGFKPIAYINDPLGFVHPEGPFFCPNNCNPCPHRLAGRCSGV